MRADPYHVPDPYRIPRDPIRPMGFRHPLKRPPLLPWAAPRRAETPLDGIQHPYYILDGHRPVPVADVTAWSEWFRTADKQVARDQVGDEVTVSTIFLGLNYNFHLRGSSAPILFQTIIFGGPAHLKRQRYSTWEEAERGHEQMVRAAGKPEP